MNADTKYYIDEMIAQYNITNHIKHKQVIDGTVYQMTHYDKVVDMWNMVDNTFWCNKRHTVLDIACKSGGFLVEAYCKFMVGLEDIIIDANKRHNHILNNQLFAIVPCNTIADKLRRTLYNKWKITGNMMVLDMTKTKFDKAEFIKLIEEKCLKEMKFDIVIGNPPYNSGMDLDFVNLGFDLCTKYCVMIMPAKWQTAADDYQGCASKTIDYKEFRRKIVPHMSHVTFYPECSEVFDIQQIDGITYCLIDKQNKYDKCSVKNVCSNQPLFNNESVRSILSMESLNNIGNEIIENIHKTKIFKFGEINSTDRYQVWGNDKPHGARGKEGIYQAKGIISYASGQMVIISEPKVIDMDNNKTEFKSYHRIVFTSNNKIECDSFASWINTKLIRFLVGMNISKLSGILTDHHFRFVPAPTPTASGNPWDHIYTDKELYKSVGLSANYIDIIEAVVKER